VTWPTGSCACFADHPIALHVVAERRIEGGFVEAVVGQTVLVDGSG
jgi:hypothetical protein